MEPTEIGLSSISGAFFWFFFWRNKKRMRRVVKKIMLFEPKGVYTLTVLKVRN
jgi:hypothetical protein